MADGAPLLERRSTLQLLPTSGDGVCREHLPSGEQRVVHSLSGEFVARIVLDLYHEERDPEWPVVCFDESSAS